MRRAALLGVLTLTAMLVIPATALAQDDAPPPLPPPTPSPAATPTVDDVHLRSGGLVRGHVEEIIPGDHVTIRVEGGETKRIPWADVERVVVSSAAAASTSAPAAGPRARVHITSPKNVILYRRAAGTTSWVRACTSPCNEELPIGDTYRVTGNGVPASKDFRLEAAPGGTVDIEVDPASTGGMIGGGFLAGAGATASYVGFLLAVVGHAAHQAATSCRPPNNADCARRASQGEDFRNAGLITLGVGAAVTVAGILIFVNNAKTEVTQSSSGRGAPHDAFLRRPTWRTASGSERALAAPAAAFPLLFEQRF